MAERGGEQPRELKSRRPLAGDVKDIRPHRTVDERDDRACEVVEPGWRVKRVDEAFDRTTLPEFTGQELKEGGLVVVESADPHAGKPASGGQPAGDFGAQLGVTVGGRRGDR